MTALYDGIATAYTSVTIVTHSLQERKERSKEGGKKQGRRDEARKEGRSKEVQYTSVTLYSHSHKGGKLFIGKSSLKRTSYYIPRKKNQSK